MAISVEDLSIAAYAVKAEGYPFPVLYDVDANVVKAYDVYNSGSRYANPNVIIVDTNGSIVWEHTGSAYHRTPNSDIIAQLEKLS